MKTIQIEIIAGYDDENRDLARYVGHARPRSGWWTVTYQGVDLDKSTIMSAKRNHRGEIIATEGGR